MIAYGNHSVRSIKSQLKGIINKFAISFRAAGATQWLAAAS